MYCRTKPEQGEVILVFTIYFSVNSFSRLFESKRKLINSELEVPSLGYRLIPPICLMNDERVGSCNTS